ncbi:MAG: hypothetical protein WD048_12205 [Chitinophagales bacterium]
MQKVISIFFTLLLLLSNISLTMATHYCAGFVVKSQLMLGKGDLDCGMHKVKEECPFHSDTKERINKVPCCENEYLTVELKEDFNQTIQKLNFDIDFVQAFAQSKSEKYFPELIFPQYGNYYPPPLDKDIQVLFQTFLI